MMLDLLIKLFGCLAVIAAVCGGFTVGLFNFLGHEDPRRGKFPDVGNTVILSDVDPSKCTQHEGKTSPN